MLKGVPQEGTNIIFFIMTAISRRFKLEDEDKEKFKHGYFQIISFHHHRMLN